jgi:hypothetical protein
VIRQWFARRRAAALTLLGGGLVTIVVATLAIISTGFDVQRFDINDGALWVVNGERQSVGRVNVQVGQLDAVIPSGSAQLDVVQRDVDVIVVDAVNAVAELIDTARSLIIESVPLPPDEPSVLLTEQNAVVHSAGSGDIWVTPRVSFADFDPATVPTFEFGPDSVLAGTDDYGFVAVSPGLGEVYRVAPQRTDRVDRTWPISVESDAPLQVTIAGDRWGVLDADTRLLHTEAGVVDLSAVVAATDDPVLSRASSGESVVFIAYRGGLLSVELEGGAVTDLVSDRQGPAAAPVVVGDCAYAAWSDGVAWRRCAGEVSQLALDALPTNADLAFMVRDTRVVLNDRRAGSAWAVHSDGRLIDNWNELIEQQDDDRQQQLDELDVPPEVERTQQPPVANDDELGARPARANVLPVLLNDSDPNGDVLVISAVTAIDATVGRLDIIGNAQQLQLTLAANAGGVVRFEYTITDGRGGSDTALVTVTVRSTGENGAPTQVRASKTSLAEGGTATAAVLAEWVDPDGDPFYLQAAAIASPDIVTFRPDGRVTVSEAGGVGELRMVALTVSDGTASGGGALAVTVRVAGQTPIIAEPFVVLTYAGQEVLIEPLRHVRGGTGTIRLSAVPEKNAVTITPSLDRGVFRFVSNDVRTHYLDYVVTDNTTTATGVIRVDVAALPVAGSAPITVPKTAFVRSLSSATVAVATVDIDPGGGVLVVTGFVGVPPTSGIRAEILDQRDVRITLTRPLDAPHIVAYRVSNGLTDSAGEITVIEIPRPDRLQPPVAVDDAITVRVGNAVTIPVLANDEHPDDEPLTLSPTLVQGLAGESGLLFVAGDTLRYLAPDRPGDFTAVYEVLGPLGQERAQATVRISVREVNEATNQAPIARTVTARVIAGDTVRVRIPVIGMDPDGDSVQVIGQETSPIKGAIVDTGFDYLDYQADSYAAGTDEFRYTVVDSVGMRASGVVRIGISPRLEGARNPVANDDEVLIRPGLSVLVPVLTNDTDPDGSALTVTGVAANGLQLSAEVVDGQFVRVVPPNEPGRYGLVYSIENERAGGSQAFITITVRADAPLAAPVARDTVLTLTDILGRDELEVDVLANVFFAEGAVSELGLELVPGYQSTAVVGRDRRIRVQVSETRQIIPFQVTHPADDSVRSTAFIWVPGTDDALPQRDRRAERIRVVSEETLTLNINDYVLAVGGAAVRLTDTARVTATQSNGDALVIDADTLRFTSAPLYFGPASLTFEVTDGDSADDPQGRRATIVLPIEVTPRDNQPPVLIGASLELEPGQERLIDLVRVTAYPYPDDADELAYTIRDAAVAAGLELTLSGQSLRVRVAENVPYGTTLGVTLGVRDDAAQGTAGRIQVSVVPSTRPLARPASDSVIAARSETTTVRVLDNDQATNPFPAEPLRVIAVRGIDGETLPPGVNIVSSADGQALLVSVAASATATDANLEYQVADATGDPSRFVWGAVRISVQDAPDPVTALRVQAFGDRSVSVAFAPGASNNAPIERFEVSATRVADGNTTVTACTSSPCTLSTSGNGPDNRVRISVVAVNSQGSSRATMLAEPVWSDLVPPAPALLQALPLDQGLRVSWVKPVQESGASPIRSYRVVVGAVTQPPFAVDADDPAGTRYVIDVGALDNGTAYSVSVSARNASFEPLTSWAVATTTGTPAGAPVALATPTAVGSVSVSGAGQASVSIDWAGVFAANGRAVQAHYVWIATSGTPPACVVTRTETGDVQHSVPPSVRQFSAAASSAVVTGLAADRVYRVVVYAFNGQGCTGSAEVTATPRERPSAVSSITVSSTPLMNGEGRWDFQLTGVTLTGPDLVDLVQYRLRVATGSGGSGGGGVDGSEFTATTLPVFLTAGTSHYGHDVQVEVRGCRQDQQLLCGDWSVGFALGVPVLIDVQRAITVTPSTPSTSTSSRTVSISYTPMSVGAYGNVSYLCQGGSSVVNPTSSPCEITAGGATDPVDNLTNDPRLTVTVLANGTTYPWEYRQ